MKVDPKVHLHRLKGGTCDFWKCHQSSGAILFSTLHPLLVLNGNEAELPHIRKKPGVIIWLYKIQFSPWDSSLFWEISSELQWGLPGLSSLSKDQAKLEQGICGCHPWGYKGTTHGDTMVIAPGNQGRQAA